jgi:NADP-dependent 3-hydroxy acid dehydrogenase YdfG
MDVKDKIVIVTGASEGIGLACAQILAHNGAKIVLAARSSDKLSVIAEQLPEALSVPTDMRSLPDIKNLFAKTLEKFGRVDILINNAGQGIYGPLEKINVDEFRQVMELNLFSVVEAMQEVIPIMRAQSSGMIINVSSRVSQNFFPNLAAYAATKYALNAISLTARKELAADNIQVAVIYPKMTATRFGVNAVGGNPDDSRATGKTAPGVDTAEDVAHKILELINSEAAEAAM